MSNLVAFSYCSGRVTEQAKKPNTAIVTIATNFLIPNVGVDEEIRRAGGAALNDEIAKKKKEDLKELVYFETGDAIFTGGGKINADGVIHAILQPIMKFSTLHVLEIQVRHLLRKGFNAIMSTARSAGINRLVIPIITPELIARDDAILIALYALSEKCKQRCEVVFVSDDSQIDAIFAKSVALYNQRSSNPFSWLDSVKFKVANDTQNNFLDRCHLPAVDFFENKMENNGTYFIGGTATYEQFPESEAVCVIVDRKLHYKCSRRDSIIASLAARVLSPIAGRSEYEPGFIFVAPSQSTVCDSVILAIPKRFPRSNRANNKSLQCVLVNMYTAIIRCASIQHFKSLVMPVFIPSGISADTSIVLAIYTCMELQDTRFDVRRVTLYHENPQIVSRILFMLGHHRNRCIPSQSFRSLCIQCFPNFPCDMTALRRLPAMINMMWDTVPTSLTSTATNENEPLSVNAVSQSMSTQSTRISIIRSDIASVSAANGCVVNAANGRLQFGDGVARALGDAAGPDTKKECAALIARYQAAGKAPLPAGSATITGCGRMTHVLRMIHAVGPILSQRQRPSDEDVYRLISAYQQTLRIAGLFQLETLVVPFISTGVYAFPQLLGMTIALYATLTELPAHNIREVIFVHPNDQTVRAFVSLMGNRTELVFSTRKEADALIRSCCASFVPSVIHDPAKTRIDTELQEIWELTKRLVTQPTTPTVPHPQAPSTIFIGGNTVKRRVTPQPPGSHKRTPPLESSTEEMDDAPLEGTQDAAAVKRLKAKLRQRARRARESQDEKAKRKKKNAERMRAKRPSQRDLQMREQKGNETRRPRRHSQTSSIRDMQERSRSPSLEIIDATAESGSNQAAETSGARQKRLDDHKKRKSIARDNETEEHEATRLAKDKQQHATTRENQSRDERVARREKDKERHKAVRENATESEKTRHRILDVLRKRRERAKKTPEQRAAIRKRDAQSKFWHRHDPSRPLRKPGSRIITDEEKNYPYSLPEYYHLGPRPVCKYCGALTYTGNCCKGGTVHVRLPSEPPKFLQDLLVGDSAKAKHFRANIMAYNRCFQMASTSSERTHTAHSNPFMKINGNIQHQMGGINQPPGASLALFNQIYPFEPKEACAARMKNWNSKHLDEEIVQELSAFLHEKNFLAKQFYAISKIEKALEDEGKQVPQRLMTLRAPTREELKGNHPGTMSRPRNELNSVLYRTDESGAAPANGVWVLKEGRRMQQLSYACPLTDPLCYPLLFPYGEESFRYGQDQLFPKGTTREQAGFVYHDAEATEFTDDERADYEWDDEEDPFAEASSLTRMQIERDVAYFDRHAMTDPDLVSMFFDQENEEAEPASDHKKVQEENESDKLTNKDDAHRRAYDRMFDDELLYEPRREINSDERQDNPPSESSDDDETSLSEEEDEEEEVSLDEVEDTGRAAQINYIVASHGSRNSSNEKKEGVPEESSAESEQRRAIEEQVVHVVNSSQEMPKEDNNSQKPAVNSVLRVSYQKAEKKLPLRIRYQIELEAKRRAVTDKEADELTLTSYNDMIGFTSCGNDGSSRMALRQGLGKVSPAAPTQKSKNLPIPPTTTNPSSQNLTTPSADIPFKKPSTTADKGHLAKPGITSTINSILDRELSLRSIDDIVAALFEGKYDEEMDQAEIDEEHRKFLRRQKNNQNRTTPTADIPFKKPSTTADKGHLSKPRITIARSTRPQATPRAWLLLKNSGSDCFLNAAIQLMRRVLPMTAAMKSWMELIADLQDEELSSVEIALRYFAILLSQTGLQSVDKLRAAIPLAIPVFEQDGLFLSSQQDCCEVIRAMMAIMPEHATSFMKFTTRTQVRCSSKTVNECRWRGSQEEEAPYYVHNVEEDDEVLDLQHIFNQAWHNDTPMGEENHIHCSSCCDCCRGAAERGEKHDDDHCPSPNCLPKKRACRRRRRTEFTGKGDYACITLNILHLNRDGLMSRKDWALSRNCDLNRMKMLGGEWQAIGIVKHTGGNAKTIGFGGHYYTYIREDDNKWWRHDDNLKPTTIGEEYNIRTDMKGVVAILFQRIRD